MRTKNFKKAFPEDKAVTKEAKQAGKKAGAEMLGVMLFGMKGGN